jgi:hypothetical protein
MSTKPTHEVKTRVLTAEELQRWLRCFTREELIEVRRAADEILARRDAEKRAGG